MKDGSEATIDSTDGGDYLLKITPDGKADWWVLATGPGKNFTLMSKVLLNDRVLFSGYYDATTQIARMGAPLIEFTPEGYMDLFLLSLDAEGAMNWSSTSTGGPSSHAYFNSAQPLEDGFIVGGVYTNGFALTDSSSRTTPMPRYGRLDTTDAFVARYSNDGSISWVDTFGGWESDLERAVTGLSDGSIVCVGHGIMQGFSLDQLRTEEERDQDGFIVRMDGDGRVAWAHSFIGGNQQDALLDAHAFRDDTVVIGADFVVETTVIGPDGTEIQVRGDGEKDGLLLTVDRERM